MPSTPAPPLQDRTFEPPAALDEPWRSFWPLAPEIDFFNHGAFGSVPFPVREAQQRWRERIEARPIEMLGRRWRELLQPARERAAGLIGADPEGLGFVTNATEGVNCVLRSLSLQKGDVILTTDHVYNAVRKSMQYLAGRVGAEVREIEIPTPVDGPDAIAERMIAALDAEPRVRVAVIDHVTSPTAILFPVARIAAACRERGIFSLIDGAHAPGMLPLDVAGIGADAYAGNLHKWVCAPKGSGLLWVDARRRDVIHPATISHFLGEGFTAEFDWQGTRDLSAWLATADAIELWEGLGWERLRRHNGMLARWAERLLVERCGLEPLTSGALDEASLLRSMATLRLPEGVRGRFEKPEDLQALLYDRHAIEIPIVDWGGRWHLRICCQAYNRPAQYERLAEVLNGIL